MSYGTSSVVGGSGSGSGGMDKVYLEMIRITIVVGLEV